MQSKSGDSEGCRPETFLTLKLCGRWRYLPAAEADLSEIAPFTMALPGSVWVFEHLETAKPLPFINWLGLSRTSTKWLNSQLDTYVYPLRSS